MCFFVLLQRLSQIDSNVRRAVTDVQSQFGDIVTFQVRWLWYCMIIKERMSISARMSWRLFKGEFLVIRFLNYKQVNEPKCQSVEIRDAFFVRQGRPYLEKMSLDRTEMFYWLQQERRQQVMDKELVKMREVTLNSPDLPPIPAHTIL